MMLDDRSPVPLYHQLHQVVRPLLSSIHVVRGDLCNLTFDISSADGR
ncbi:MAG TPA: hypothetical protein VFD42_02040 [Chloroflexota bacterium]|nr:hypothetical protein [Chloroflexota bacterium]